MNGPGAKSFLREAVRDRGASSRPRITIPTGTLNVVLYAGFLEGLFMHRPRQEVVLALTLVAIYTMPHLVFYAQPCYKLPVLPVVALIAAVSASGAIQRLSRRLPVLAVLRVDDHQGGGL